MTVATITSIIFITKRDYAYFINYEQKCNCKQYIIIVNDGVFTGCNRQLVNGTNSFPTPDREYNLSSYCTLC